ncbi:MAG TPA: prepilin-type N-terminal cleavage/methylation domain-containing protein [Fimbriimonadales bacterium]|nr:prepilin-type N-terminal cleavage/methylation domain-containing protein [Fimbriimonadales bacterium]
MNRRARALTLIELLVVIVVLAVGILTFIRIYPRGFFTLSLSRDYAKAQALARREIDRLERNAENLPLQILAVRYNVVNIGGNDVWQLVADATVSPFTLGAGGIIDEDGYIDVDNKDVFWRYYNDANRFRRVIGDGGAIPVPKQVGNHFGCLRILQFAPIAYGPDYDPNLLLVYSNDMIGEPLMETQAGQSIKNPALYQFKYDNEVPQMWLPGIAGRDVRYKINFSFYVSDPTTGYQRVDVIDQVVTVTENASFGDPLEADYDPATNTVKPFDLLAIAGVGGQFRGLDPDSITANRLFDPIPESSVFDPTYPYEYKVLNAELGMLLFNPIAYRYREPRPRGTRPLVAQVNYDVLDWHIIRDEFRADNTKRPLHKLSLERIKAIGNLQNDQRRYPGLGIPFPDGTGNFVQMDVAVIDLETGGLVLPFVNPNNWSEGRSYKIDYLRGTISLGSPFNPPPQNQEDLAQSITILPPGTSQSPITGINPAGRNFRVLYQAHNDWAVQVLKASARFRIVGSYLPGDQLGVGECYVGGWDSNLAGLPTRVYFPWCELGSKVTIREIWYWADGVLKTMRDQDFLIRAPRPQDTPNLPYIDITDVDASADTFDWQTYGYAVRGVAGATVRARVLWNTDRKEDVPGNTANDIQERMFLHDRWTEKWRYVIVESYLSRRDAL